MGHYHVLNKITYPKLAKLFNVSIHTVKQWTYTNKLNPYSLEDIIYKYNNKELLDKRTKVYATHSAQPDSEEYTRQTGSATQDAQVNHTKGEEEP